MIPKCRAPQTAGRPDAALSANCEVVKESRSSDVRPGALAESPENYHRKSVEEVAEIIGIAEATVKTRMF